MTEIYTYRGRQYPGYLKHGNMQQFIAPTAAQYCIGRGLDVGAGAWPLPWAEPVELTHGGSAESLPDGEVDFVFSSHCLEHLLNPVAALEHWKTRIRPGGVLFLYLPHPDMVYWRPENCRKHLRTLHPGEVAEMLRALGFVDVIHSERDLAWSFSVVGFNGKATAQDGDRRDA